MGARSVTFFVSSSEVTLGAKLLLLPIESVCLEGKCSSWLPVLRLLLPLGRGNFLPRWRPPDVQVTLTVETQELVAIAGKLNPRHHQTICAERHQFLAGADVPEFDGFLAASGRVIAVFQGHTHNSAHAVIDGIHYVTFAGMVDADVPTPASWAAVTLDPTARTIHVEGVGLQETLDMVY